MSNGYESVVFDLWLNLLAAVPVSWFTVGTVVQVFFFGGSVGNAK